jgi:hypothetical protein
MKSNTRIVLALVISFLVGLVLALINGRDLLLSLQSALFFAIISTVIVAILTWGMDTSLKKGFPDWVGFSSGLILEYFRIGNFGSIAHKKHGCQPDRKMTRVRPVSRPALFGRCAFHSAGGSEYNHQAVIHHVA